MPEVQSLNILPGGFMFRHQETHAGGSYWATIEQWNSRIIICAGQRSSEGRNEDYGEHSFDLQAVVQMRDILTAWIEGQRAVDPQ